MLTNSMLIGYLKSMVGEAPLEADSALFSNGMLDSMLMVNLITFVEQKAQIQVRGEDVTLDNFDTPGRIVRFAQSQV